MIVSASQQMRDILALVERVAARDTKVLITGESGVGKDLVAREIHMRVRRARVAPFIAVNCAGLTETLLESELFGHVKGSFTGAYRDKPGKLQLAHSGTLFLDEVGEMSLRMQALLLRFLENGEIQAVGADHARSTVDVRVVAATNRNLADMVANGQFREDLLYRLRVIHIHVPPLRERKEDIRVARRVSRVQGGTARQLHGRSARAHSSAIAGRATSASCRTSSSRRSGWPTVASSKWRTCRRPCRHRPITCCRSRSAASRWPTSCISALVSGGYSFWEHIHPLFLQRDITRHDMRELVRRGPLDDAWELPVAAAAVRHAGVGLQAVPELPGRARLQRGLPRVPQRHGPDRADALRRGCCRHCRTTE